jgi:membrane protein
MATTGVLAEWFNVDFIIKDLLKTFIAKQIPTEFISALKPRMDEIISTPSSSVLKIAILGAIWTASSIVEESRYILNKAYRVQNIPPYIWRRVLSVIQFILIVILIILIIVLWTKFPILLANLILSITTENPKNFIITNNGYFDSFMAISIIFLSLSYIYARHASEKQKWIHVFPGTILVVIMWYISVLTLKIYIKKSNQLAVIYGSMQGIIVSMLFFYFMSICFIYGAEFNYNFIRIFKLNTNKIQHKKKSQIV